MRQPEKFYKRDTTYDKNNTKIASGYGFICDQGLIDIAKLTPTIPSNPTVFFKAGSGLTTAWT